MYNYMSYFGDSINKLGKKEKHKKILEGDCIIPFNYKWKSHDECFATDKGDICATSVSDRNTLKTYGYCVKKSNKKLSTKKKALSPRKTLKKKNWIEATDKYGDRYWHIGDNNSYQQTYDEQIALSQDQSPQKIELETQVFEVNKIKTKSKSPRKETINKIETELPFFSQEDKTKLKSKSKSKSKSPKMEQNWNKEFINMLGELEEIMMKQGEPMRARAYKNAQESIMLITEPITDLKQLKGVKGIGDTILRKFKEYMETGTLAVLVRERNNPVNLLAEVYGIGAKKAKELVEKGITTIEELRNQQELLNDTQKIGLKYYEAIQERIPRAEIEKYKQEFQKVFDKVKTDGSTFDIVGSYRRGAANSGDIDIIITDQTNDKSIFKNFIEELIKDKIIKETLTKGATKSLTITQLGDDTPRRVDFLYTSPAEYGFAVLYFTGSKAFNVGMRQRALDLGYSLNEHGLYKMLGKTKGDKIKDNLPDEMSIFDFLGMEYKTPKERVDGRAVKIASTKIETIEPDATEQQKIIEKEPEKMKIKVKKTTLKKKLKKSALTNITEFKKSGIDSLKLLSEGELNEIIIKANAAYYNEENLMTDNEYDIIKEFIERKYPKNKIIEQIGAPVEKDKVELPYPMPSMDKIKPDTKALGEWMVKYPGPYVLSAKLDGISALFTTEGDKPQLYTRGNGKVGQNISHMIPYLKLPTTTKDITIRGELIMTKNIFKDKYSATAANGRNLVAGIVNSTKSATAEKYRDLDFVAYEVLSPELNPSEQMNFIKDTLKIIPVLNEEKSILSNEILSEILINWRESYQYEIDGVIVADDKIYPRTDKNPKHSFAFKMVLSDQVVEAKVLNVLWSPSKHGLLKPRIQIEPVIISGATIEYATAFNGSFVENNKIGIGSVVRLVRSGDVIPHILAVIEPSSEPKMPEMPYIWNETHVDIILKDFETDEIVKEKTVAAFFKGLDIAGLSSGNVKRIMNAGFDTIPKIVHMTKEDLLGVEGFKDKMATKIHSSIKDKISEATLSKLISLSNLFGRGLGDKRIAPILAMYPDILVSDKTPKEKEALVRNVSGIAQKTAELFVKHIPEVISFITDIGEGDKLIAIKAPDKDIDTNHPLYNKNIVMTGFRDKDLENKITDVGGNLAGSISKTTFVVLVKDINESTGKADKARDLNIPLMIPQEFITAYLA